jgi:acetyltransferase
MDISSLLHPHSVAVVGASEDPLKVGYAVLRNILDGAPRTIYPVTLGATQVLGLPAYASIADIPEQVDLAVIAVRADLVASIVQACGEKKIPAVIVISAGFKEEGEEGKKREEELTHIAREYNITLLGPNCLGALYTPEKWNASFAPSAPLAGNIAFLSQSGALGTALLDEAKSEGVGFSAFVSLGNEAVLTECDFLPFFRDDQHTHAILLYLEQVRDGNALLSTLRDITPHKPVAILRAGRSESGARAVLSHTGSLAPSDAVFSSALRQVGAIPVETLRDFVSLAKLFSLGFSHTHTPHSFIILTNGGGPSVHATDRIELSKNLSLAPLTEEAQEAIKKVLPPMAGTKNPIDVLGDAPAQRYKDTLAILEKEHANEHVLAIVTPQMMTDARAIAEVLANTHTRHPLIPIFMGGSAIQDGRTALTEHGLCSFSNPSDAISALDLLAEIASEKKNAYAPHTSHTPQEHPESTPLSYVETMRLLTPYHLALDGILVDEHTSFEGACLALGKGPFALKAISPQTTHKTEFGAIRVGLADATALEKARIEMSQTIRAKAPDFTPEGFLVQKMATGVECIVGMKRDPVFGPTLLFGLGGIFVEVFRDTALRVAPLTTEEAKRQIGEIKGAPLLFGARGATPVDINALAHLLVSLGTLALQHPEVAELDCNPVFASPTGISLVDVRILITTH